MNRFVHLNCHSNFSLLFGGSSADELVRRCAELEMDTLALTDRDGLYCSVPFFEKAVEAGIKPVIGCDLSVAVPSNAAGKVAAEGRVILLARNDEGYGNLCRAVTERRLGEEPLSLDRLEALRGGLYALCGDATLLEPLAATF